METRTPKPAAKPAARADKKPRGSQLLDALASVPEATKPRVKSDAKTAIVDALKRLRKVANDPATPFVAAKTAAERKALEGKGILTRRAYVALIDRALAATVATDNVATLKPIREEVGQALYYGARLVSSGPLADVVGPYVGARRASGSTSYVWTASALSKDAGVFSSRVQAS